MKTTLYEIIDILASKFPGDDNSVVDVISYLFDSGQIRFCD